MRQRITFVGEELRRLAEHRLVATHVPERLDYMPHAGTFSSTGSLLAVELHAAGGGTFPDERQIPRDIRGAGDIRVGLAGATTSGHSRQLPFRAIEFRVVRQQDIHAGRGGDILNRLAESLYSLNQYDVGVAGVIYARPLPSQLNMVPPQIAAMCALPPSLTGKMVEIVPAV